MSSIGDRVKQFRTAAGMSQQALAAAAELSTSVVSQIEQGQKEDPRTSTMKALARALGVTIDDLVRDAAPPATAKGKASAEGKPAGKGRGKKRAD